MTKPMPSPNGTNNAKLYLHGAFPTSARSVRAQAHDQGLDYHPPQRAAPRPRMAQDAPWSGLYEANKGVIGGNENLIRPGQQLNVGGGQMHTVQSGETLSGISRQYGNPNPASGGASGATYEAPSHQTSPTAGALRAAASQAGGGSYAHGSSAPLPPERPAGLAQQGPGAGAMRGWANPSEKNYTESNTSPSSSSQVPNMSAAGSGGPSGSYASSSAPLPPSKPAGLQQTQEPGSAASRFEQSQLASNDEDPDEEPNEAPGVPWQAMAFLKSRLLPDELKQFTALLHREAQSRPLSGSSEPAMDRRRADGRCYLSMTHGQLIGMDGRVTRRTRPMDLSRARAELEAFVKTGRR